MFITDRDLLAYEPNLFRDAAWIGQRLTAGSGTLAASELTAVGGVNFESLGIGPGHVLLLQGAPVEVMARVTSAKLAVSLPRAGATASTIPVVGGGSHEFTVYTLAPQIAQAHEIILRLIGLDAAAASAPPGGPVVDESRIMNPGGLARLESLLTLHAVYAALAAMRPADDPMSLRADLYRQRVRAERQAAVALLDTDFDGRADVVRRLNAVVLRR